MRSTASILHLDLDAFFASVEQRDKPSLKGRPVIVGGVGARGVVSTASYEARKFGVHSAMATREARWRCPSGAFLIPRFDAYQQSSRVVMALLKQLSPLVEPLSIDEAFVDLAAGEDFSGDLDQIAELVRKLREDVVGQTCGLSASVGVGSSKFMAKLATGMAKPDGFKVITPGSELEIIADLSVKAIPGVGEATATRLARIAVFKISDLRKVSVAELEREVGKAAAESLHQFAFAEDDRAVQPEREAKSISVEDTFEQDIVDAAELAAIVERDAAIVAAKLVKQQLFAKTINVKIRTDDFATITRARTLEGSTDSVQRIAAVAQQLVAEAPISGGVRLLGVGVSNFTMAAQEELFFLDEDTNPVMEQIHFAQPPPRRRFFDTWMPGMEVIHEEHGRGWVWGQGAGRVTVRFESRLTEPGPIETFSTQDPLLTRAPLLPLPGDDLVEPDDLIDSGPFAAQW